jgi:hypothetical protein
MNNWWDTDGLAALLLRGRLEMGRSIRSRDASSMFNTGYPCKRHLTVTVRVMIDFLRAAFADTPCQELAKPTT